MTGYTAAFRGKLFRYPGAGGWHFVPVPEKHAPLATHAWGRTPVMAMVDGHEWKTSVWREKSGRTLLAVPQRVRGTKGDGDMVAVKLNGSSLELEHLQRIKQIKRIRRSWARPDGTLHWSRPRVPRPA